jgi:hypothetical protein
LTKQALDEAGIAVRQVHREEVDLTRNAANHSHRLAKVHLGVTRRVMERHEHLPATRPALTDIVLHDRVAAGEPVLCMQPIEYPLRRVALLSRAFPVLLKDLVDDAGERIELRARDRLAAAISRGNRERPHLVDRLAVQPVYPSRLSAAHTLYQTRMPNPRVQLHSVHPPTFRQLTTDQRP